MTNILGIKFGGHDTAAALLVDGEVVAACAQERYTRDKHSRRFPKEAATDCLRINGIDINQVDEIAFVNDLRIYIREIYLRPALQSNDRMDFLFNDIDRILRAHNMDNIIRENLNYTGKINYYRHHLCHIASSYYPSGFKDALCLSIDGVGEFETGMLAAGYSGQIKILNRKNVYPNSFGLLYSAITDYLGWKHHCDEGIVMGLAPYGDPSAIIPGKDQSYLSVFEEILIEIGDFEYQVNNDFIDYAIVMNYESNINKFNLHNSLIKNRLSNNKFNKIVMGISIFNQDAKSATDKILLSRLNGYQNFSLFNYNAEKDTTNWYDPIYHLLKFNIK